MLDHLFEGKRLVIIHQFIPKRVQRHTLKMGKRQTLRILLYQNESSFSYVVMYSAQEATSIRSTVSCRTSSTTSPTVHSSSPPCLIWQSLLLRVLVSFQLH